MTWHAIYTNPRSEFLAQGELNRLVGQTFCPFEWVTIRHARKVEKIRRPLWQRYLLADFTIDDYGLVLRTRGVHSVICYQDSEGRFCPVKIPDSVVAKEMARGETRTIDEIQRQRLRVGQLVRVLEGPFAGFSAVVNSDNGSEISVWLQGLGRQLRVDMLPEAVT